MNTILDELLEPHDSPRREATATVLDEILDEPEADELDRFFGLDDLPDWLSGVFGGSGSPSYPVTTGEEYGGHWNGTRPPGLPTSARKAGAVGSALADVRAFAAHQGLGTTFVRAVVQMAKMESAGRYALPAITFNANPPALRPPGKRLVTAWGVFQFNRDAWTCLFPSDAERSKRSSYVPNGTAGCSGCGGRGGCVFPWDSTPSEEIEKPILRWAELFREVRAAGGSKENAAAGLRLFHKSPAAFREWLDEAEKSGFAAAWRRQPATRVSQLRRFLERAGIARPASMPSNELELVLGSWAKNFRADVREAIATGASNWPMAMQLAINSGIRDSSDLANIAFFMHFPDRNGRPIDPSEPDAPALVEAWTFFRTSARNLLRAQPSTGPVGPVPEVDTLLPSAAPGLVAQKPSSLRYGLPETIAALEAIGRAWQAKHPSGPRIQIRDISRRGGGPLPPHGSHRMGIDVDIRIMRNDGVEGTANFRTRPKQYSRSLTRDMIDTIHENPVLRVHKLWFADKGIKKNVNHDNRHYDHVHVRFCLPAKYSLAAMKKAAFRRGTRGSYRTCP